MNSRYLRDIDAKVGEILDVPESWGGADVLEPLVLALLQLRARVEAGASADSDAQVLRRYR